MKVEEFQARFAQRLTEEFRFLPADPWRRRVFASLRLLRFRGDVAPQLAHFDALIVDRRGTTMEWLLTVFLIGGPEAESEVDWGIHVPAPGYRGWLTTIDEEGCEIVAEPAIPYHGEESRREHL